MKKFIFLSGLLLLSGCAASADAYQAYLKKRGVAEPSSRVLSHCRGYGCQYVDSVKLSAADWKKIRRTFGKPAKNSEKERKKITLVVQAFENIVGRMTGTDQDVQGTFEKSGTYQLDCVDESTNTTSYIAILQNENLLRFHTLLPPTARLPLIHSGFWPHQTAVILDKSDGQSYVVDSWFHKNGVLPEIVLLETWKSGWEPDVR